MSDNTKPGARTRFFIKHGTVLAGAILPEGVTTLRAPEGVKDIEDSAFCDRSDIKEIILPQSLERAGIAAFCKCTPDRIVIPHTLSRIGRDAFRCTGEVFISSEKGEAPLFALSEPEKKTADMERRLELIRNADFMNSYLAYNHRSSQAYYICQEGMKLAGSSYIVTEDERALRFLLSERESLILFTSDNTAALLKKLIDKGVADDELLLDIIKRILLRKDDYRQSEYSVLCFLLDYMKHDRSMDMYGFSQQELVKYIIMNCPVPYERIWFRVKAEGLEINYMCREKDTGYYTGQDNEEERYGFILNYRRPADIRGILADRTATFHRLHTEHDGGETWTAATFIVEADGRYRLEYEYGAPLSNSEWEQKYGMISAPSEPYPAEKLQEQTDADYAALGIDPDTEDEDDDSEEHYLIRRGRALTDSYAAFINRVSGREGVRRSAEASRKQQLEKMNDHPIYYYYTTEIVREYEEYVRQVRKPVLRRG